MQRLHEAPTNSSSSTTCITGSVTSSAILLLCCLVGIPSNIMVIRRIARNFKKENFTLKLMLNLAAADVLCLITLPAWIYNIVQDWGLGVVMCKLLSFVSLCSMYNSVLTVTFMSVQRYMQVLNTQYWARLRERGESVLLIISWGLSCVLISPGVIRGRGLVNMKCRWFFTSEREKVTYLLFHILIGFVIPYSILLTCYCCLHKKLNQRAFFSSQRLTKLVNRILLTYLIFFTPTHVINLLQVTVVLLKTSQVETSARLQTFCDNNEKFASSLTFINSCINPFLYAFASRNIQRNHQGTAMEPPRNVPAI